MKLLLVEEYEFYYYYLEACRVRCETWKGKGKLPWIIDISGWAETETET